MLAANLIMRGCIEKQYLIYGKISGVARYFNS